MININIKNCNNIDSANITLTKNILNIKFAPNGTGKSTIAKAIILGVTDSSKLDKLKPFKLQLSEQDDKKPEISGLKDIKSVMCFNEEYVQNFVFKPEELLDNSFNIFIKTESYKKHEKEIKALIGKINKLFVNNKELECLINKLDEMGKAFKLTKTGLSKSSTGMKALSGGNKIQNIPVELKPYQPFIQSKDNIDWINWQIKGNNYTEISNSCPFCTSDTTPEKKELIRSVGEKYDKSKIKNLVAIIEIIKSLGDYFSDSTRGKLSTITSLNDGIEKEHEVFLISIKGQIDSFKEKLLNLKELSGFHFKEGDKVSEKLSSYKLELNFFSDFDSVKTQNSIKPFNESIDALINNAGKLQGLINQQQREMQKTAKKHKKDINNFLSYAGYSYKVEMKGDGEQIQLKLFHIDRTQYINGGNQYLSFGEKNAFALVLFMYECLSKKPDLIILDDPISSFDKNKKYAILQMLFRGKTGSCLRDKTVLMLTHDFEPIIDTIKSLSRQFDNHTSAFFLELNNGIINDILIEKNDIKIFSQICKDIFESDKHILMKLIYLRRYYEILDNKNDGYQVLSNLFHKRNPALDYRERKSQGDTYPKMESCKFKQGCSDIEKKLEKFSYDCILKKVSDIGLLKLLYRESTNRYEKLQLFRLLNIEDINSVVKKFINEVYHIENEFIYQLDPNKFNIIPQYVIVECDKVILHQAEIPAEKNLQIESFG